MNRLLQYLQARLSCKLFLSYMLVIVLGSLALFIGAQLYMPAAFERHMAAMAAEMPDAVALRQDLFSNFRQALTESMAISAVTSTLIALVTSAYVSRRIGGVIREMTRASQRIADGHYGERISVSSERAHPDELEQLAASFDQLAAALEHTEMMRRELIGNVAHELRTPLTAIKGYMEALMDGVLPSEEEIFAKVYSEADRLQHLVNDLEQLSRLEEGAYHLEFEPISAGELVQDAIDHLAPQYAEKGVTLHFEPPTRPLSIRVDRDRILQVLYNLLGNALQYTPSGGTVTVRLDRLSPDRVAIRVQDTGIGIAPEHISHLFERFYRVDPSRARAGGGSGIGLTIARHLAQAHGGEIRVHSQGLGLGSEFTLELPLT